MLVDEWTETARAEGRGVPGRKARDLSGWGSDGTANERYSWVAGRSQ